LPDSDLEQCLVSDEKAGKRTGIMEAAFSGQHSAVSQDQNQNQDQQQEQRQNLEWRPTPDMYRTDTPEGREAYAACFGTKIDGTKIKPGSSGEQRPTQAVIAREERTGNVQFILAG
jgi:hypothetical protein